MENLLHTISHKGSEKDRFHAVQFILDFSEITVKVSPLSRSKK